jgi:hypothetical protein
MRKSDSANAARNVLAAMNTGAVTDPWFGEVAAAFGRLIEGEQGWVRVARTPSGMRLSIRRGREPPRVRHRGY